MPTIGVSIFRSSRILSCETCPFQRRSDEEKAFVLEMPGLDTSSDEDCDLVVNKVSHQYSASPPSFDQLDSGTTKSISSRPDLFSYIWLAATNRDHAPWISIHKIHVLAHGSLRSLTA
jgi:hypothetical protein